MADGEAVGVAGSGARRGRPGHDQETVLRAAVDLFNQQGYDGTSMGDLARELGLTKSAIYHHVPSKEHLLELAVGEALDALTSALDDVAARPGLTAEERLRHAVRSSVTVLVEHLPAVTLLLRVHGNTPVEQAALRRRREVDRRLATMVRDAVDEGGVRDDLDPLLVSRLVFGMVNSLTEWVRRDHGSSGTPGPSGTPGTSGADAAALADAVSTLAFDGLTRGVRRPGQEPASPTTS